MLRLHVQHCFYPMRQDNDHLCVFDPKGENRSESYVIQIQVIHPKLRIFFLS